MTKRRLRVVAFAWSMVQAENIVLLLLLADRKRQLKEGCAQDQQLIQI